MARESVDAPAHREEQCPQWSADCCRAARRIGARQRSVSQPLVFAFVCGFKSGRMEAAGGADVGGGIEVAAALNRYGQVVLGGRFVDAGRAGQRFLRVVFFGAGVDLGER